MLVNALIGFPKPGEFGTGLIVSRL